MHQRGIRFRARVASAGDTGGEKLRTSPVAVRACLGDSRVHMLCMTLKLTVVTAHGHLAGADAKLALGVSVAVAVVGAAAGFTCGNVGHFREKPHRALP